MTWISQQKKLDYLFCGEGLAIYPKPWHDFLDFVLNWHMGIFRQIAEYLYIKKPDPAAPRSQWMKYMHGINRISIFMFLAGIVLLLIRIFFFRR